MPKPPDDEHADRGYAADPRRQPPSFGETLLDRQIREAVEQGSFDNLPHQGKPLPKDENPYATEWGVAFHLLKNAGFAPPWIEADKEVRALLARRDAILDRAATGPAPSPITQGRDRIALERLVSEANASIASLNAEAPSTRQHRRRLVVDEELRRYDEACRR